MSEKINWDDILVGGNFIKLEEGKAKQMEISNWRVQQKFKDDKTKELRPGLTFDVLNEDGVASSDIKEWTVTSVRALGKLRPIIEKAEAEGKTSVRINVVRVGDKTATQYSITQINI